MAESKREYEHEKDRRTADDTDDDFCLADALTPRTDAEIEQMAEEHAETDVTSSAYAGIPLDKEKLKARLLATYQQMRAKRAAAQPPPVNAVALPKCRQQPIGP